MNEPKAKYQIEDTFKIKGRGIVFAGKILNGIINNGDLIEFKILGEKLVRKIIGIDGTRTTEAKPDMGILIECDNESEIDKLQNWNPDQTTALIYPNDESKKQSKNLNILNKNVIHGIIQMLFSVYWLWHYGRLMYLYHFTDIAFFFMYPDWKLILFITLSIFGITVGYIVLIKKMKIKISYYLISGLLFIGFIFDYIIP